VALKAQNDAVTRLLTRTAPGSDGAYVVAYEQQ
jgi:hypothetical protein